GPALAILAHSRLFGAFGPVPAARPRPGEGGVGVVDLRHLAGGEPRCLGIVTGQVRMMLAGQTPPRRLDLGGARARLDPENSMWIGLCHAPMIWATDVPWWGPATTSTGLL